MKPDYRVIITTSDKYLPALRPMVWLMTKYWSPMPDVIVGGFKSPDFELPSCWEFVSIGKQEDYPIDKWSDGIIDLLNKLDDEIIVILLEDMWPVRTVNTGALRILCDYMRQFEYVARIDLTTDRLYAHGMRDYGVVSWIDLVASMPGSPYHMSFMGGMWRREHLLSVLVRGESPWDVELIGTPRLSHNRDVIVLGTRQWPLRHTLALRGGDSSKLLTDELDEEDVKALRELGYLEAWE